MSNSNVDKKEISAFQKQTFMYHAKFPVGKMSIRAKSCTAQELQYAYTPGVGYICEQIKQDPQLAKKLTMVGNNVCVISNGTAVLGLGDLGALASKPVMEGKALLMRKLAGISATELCIEEKDVDKLFHIIKACSVSFGCINLEDIKAPECFILLEKLQNTLNIPVFHDDQDGTAVVVVVALLNALKLVGKDLRNVKLVGMGAGAAMIASLRLLEEFGLKPEQVFLFDSKGYIDDSRDDLSEQKARYAKSVSDQDPFIGADVFLGLSAANMLSLERVGMMCERPVILAMANPVPEILPEQVYKVRPHAIVGTGRSDFPNQVNNSTCFPYLFRAVLDCGASKITLNMLKAMVEGLMELVGDDLSPTYIIPSTIEPRLPYFVVNKVIKAAVTDRVATLEPDHKIMHAYMFDVSVWNELFELKPRNNVELCIDSMHYLNEYIKHFSATNAQDHWKIQAKHNGELNLVHLFRAGDEVLSVQANGVQKVDDFLFNQLKIQTIQIDLQTCFKLYDYICSLDVERKIAYVSPEQLIAPSKVMFTSALISVL